MATRNITTYPTDATLVYVTSESSEALVGYVTSDRTVLELRGDQSRPIGRVTTDRKVSRRTAHGEREVGHYTNAGAVFSIGVMEGGAVGWLDPDGVVVRGGLILGEEEVGRVSGPQPQAAAAALLLIFLPDLAEANRLADR